MCVSKIVLLTKPKPKCEQRNYMYKGKYKKRGVPQKRAAHPDSETGGGEGRDEMQRYSAND